MTTDVLSLGVSARVSFQRSAAVRDGDRLPRATGTYPLRWVDDPGGRVLTLPVGPDEAVWLSLRADEPTALQVIVDGVNAVTAEPVREADGPLQADPQDHVVVPGQHWVDGVATADGTAAQMLGPGAAHGGASRLMLVARRLHGAAFRRWWVATDQDRRFNRFGVGEPVSGGAGHAGDGDQGPRVPRRLVPDPFGMEEWEEEPFSVVEVRLLDPSEW